MAALAATSSGTPSLQSMLIRSRLAAARRDADQAEAYAESLRVQADNQGKVVEQARQRVNTLNASASTLATTNGASSSASTKKVPVVPDAPTYSGTLAGVFQLAKPILTSDLSSTQKNLVKGSLFKASDTLWSADQTRSQAVQSYTSQIANTTTAIGQTLNATA